MFIATAHRHSETLPGHEVHNHHRHIELLGADRGEESVRPQHCSVAQARKAELAEMHTPRELGTKAESATAERSARSRSIPSAACPPREVRAGPAETPSSSPAPPELAPTSTAGCRTPRTHLTRNASKPWTHGVASVSEPVHPAMMGQVQMLPQRLHDGRR